MVMGFSCVAHTDTISFCFLQLGAVLGRWHWEWGLDTQAQGTEALDRVEWE